MIIEIESLDRYYNENISVFIYLINKQIRDPQVLVVDENGTKLGVMKTFDAINLAQNKDLDLVLFVPKEVTKSYSICKIIDYGKFAYQQQIKQKQAKKNQHEVKVNEVKEVKLPDLDKDFFEDLGMEGIDSKESLEDQVKKNIKTRKENAALEKYTDDLLAEIAKNTEVDIPYTMIDDEVNHMVDHFKEHIMMQGITIEQFYSLTNSSEVK